MGKSTLTFTQEDADRIYDELRQLHAELDADPLAFGPKRLNQKVAQVRGMLDRCEQIFLDVAQRLHQARRAFRIASTDLELAKKDLYATDPETRSQRSVGDREAVATGKLKTEVVEVNQLEVLVHDLDSVLTVVKAKRSDLRDTQGRLRDQIRLCQEEIGLGNHWGSKSPSGAPNLSPTPVDGVSDIDNLLSGVDGEIHLGTQQGDWEEPEEFDPGTRDLETDDGTDAEQDQAAPEEALPATVSADAVDSFLDEPAPELEKSKTPSKPTVKVDDGLNLDEILSGFEDLD